MDGDEITALGNKIKELIRKYVKHSVRLALYNKGAGMFQIRIKNQRYLIAKVEIFVVACPRIEVFAFPDIQYCYPHLIGMVELNDPSCFEEVDKLIEKALATAFYYKIDSAEKKLGSILDLDKINLDNKMEIEEVPF